MATKHRHTLAYWMSTVAAIAVLSSMLPPPKRSVAQSLVPEDYIQRLLAVSPTLEQSSDGDISFPYPAAQSDSIDTARSPFALVPISGQSSRQNMLEPPPTDDSL